MGNLAGHFYRGLERFTLGDYSLPMLFSMLCLLHGRLRREINIEYLRVLFFFLLFFPFNCNGERKMATAVMFEKIKRYKNRLMLKNSLEILFLNFLKYQEDIKLPLKDKNSIKRILSGI